jgi:hypothetical protein
MEINANNARLFFGDTEVTFTEMHLVDKAEWSPTIPQPQDFSATVTVQATRSAFTHLAPVFTRLKIGNVAVDGRVTYIGTPDTPVNAKPTTKKIIRHLKAIGRYDVVAFEFQAV